MQPSRSPFREDVASERSSSQTVRQRIDAPGAGHGADEAMITITPDDASRERSYALFADAFALERRAS